MKEKDFQSLLEAVREAKQSLRGETNVARTLTVEVLSSPSLPETGFVICLQTDDPTLLIPLKIYAATFSKSGFVRVTDETGEAAVYPEGFFLPISFPKEVAQLLAQFAA
ncbi:MAG: hypothetical protein QOH63_984 [Acidobacteriota bacterium]|jgi:hypothetical protein|nr:hypothetical protein [Acidobacteriota bacterium]